MLPLALPLLLLRVTGVGNGGADGHTVGACGGADGMNGGAVGTSGGVARSVGKGAGVVVFVFESSFFTFFTVMSVSVVLSEIP